MKLKVIYIFQYALTITLIEATGDKYTNGIYMPRLFSFATSYTNRSGLLLGTVEACVT